MGEYYIGVGNKPKKSIGSWLGVNNVPKKIKGIWMGVNNSPKPVLLPVTYYTITLNATYNGGSGGGSFERESGTTFNLSTYSAQKGSITSNGYHYTYTFKGWYTATSGGSKITSTTVSGNKTYYAQFTESSSLILQKPSVSSAVKSTKTVKWNAVTGATKYMLFKSGNSAGSARDRSVIYANDGHKLTSSETIDTYKGTFLTGTSKTFGNSNYMYEVCVVAYDNYGNHLASNWYTAT